jgi:hypothetical protein
MYFLFYLLNFTYLKYICKKFNNIDHREPCNQIYMSSLQTKSKNCHEKANLTTRRYILFFCCEIAITFAHYTRFVVLEGCSNKPFCKKAQNLCDVTQYVYPQCQVNYGSG